MGVNVGLLSWGELERAGRADSREGEGEGEVKEEDRAGGRRGGARHGCARCVVGGGGGLS